MKKFFRVLFNIFWVLLVGIGSAVGCFFCAILSCVLIVPIFFGVPKVYFNAIPLVFAPAGKTVKLHFSDALVRNVIYMVFGGFLNMIGNYFLGVILCCTIIFIPIGLQQLKFAKYWVGPFKAEVIKK